MLQPPLDPEPAVSIDMAHIAGAVPKQSLLSVPTGLPIGVPEPVIAGLQVRCGDDELTVNAGSTMTLHDGDTIEVVHNVSITCVHRPRRVIVQPGVIA